MNADTIAVPGICSDPIRDKASEEAIEIEQEQDGSAEKVRLRSSYCWVWVLTRQRTGYTTRGRPYTDKL